MPVLEWIGKEKVVNHADEVPFHVLERSYSYGAEDSQNKIIHGDNLVALKALLPEYEGRVKCIYIDPPYNTGNEGWVYNDRVNDPRIVKWLGEVVGKEGEDLSRHDKWLCMMYPRLKLLQRLLAEDGAIFISIDDNEQANLKLICDEIFGGNHFQGCIVRGTGQTTGQDSHGLGSSFDYIFVYSKSLNYQFGGLSLSDKDLKRFENEDERGRYAYDQLRKTGSNDRREDRPNMYYPIIDPDGNELYPTATAGYESCWRVEKKRYLELVADDYILWKKTTRNKKQVWWPYVKYYLEGRTKRPSPLWNDIEGNKKASRDVKEILGANLQFDYPKPVEMLERIIQIATDKDSIVLDSFAGSGTTAHAVLNLNKADGGNRKFILVEMMDYAESITAERVKRVIDGYGEGKKKTEGTGGGFSFYEVGEPLLVEVGLNEAVDEEKIRAYIWYTETRMPYRKPTKGSPAFLGCAEGTAVYFHYEKDETTTLDAAFLRTVKEKAERYVIYADVCVLAPEMMEARNIVFRKIPRDIRHV